MLQGSGSCGQLGKRNSLARKSMSGARLSRTSLEACCACYQVQVDMCMLLLGKEHCSWCMRHILIETCRPPHGKLLTRIPKRSL